MRNTLPRPGSLSSPTGPPIRSTATGSKFFQNWKILWQTGNLREGKEKEWGAIRAPRRSGQIALPRPCSFARGHPLKTSGNPLWLRELWIELGLFAPTLAAVKGESQLFPLLRVNLLNSWRRLKSLHKTSGFMTAAVVLFVVSYQALSFVLFCRGFRSEHTA